MKSVLKPLALTVALALAGFSAYAAGSGESPGCMGEGMSMHNGTGHHGMGRMDPAKMQARMDKRQAELKAKLKITAAQEAAWTTYVATIKLPAGMIAKSTEWADMAKLPTPERIDKMKALRSQRMNEMSAAMDRRGDAIKTLYAALTPEQQNIIDTQAMGHRGRGGYLGGQHHGNS